MISFYSFLRPKAIFQRYPEKTASPFALGTTISTRSISNHSLRRRRQSCLRSKIDFVRRPVSRLFAELEEKRLEKLAPIY
jgi:hypothetical protein